MDIGRPLKLIDIRSNGEMEVTTEGIALLQSFPNNIGLVCVIGPPCIGKSNLANRILERTNGFELGNGRDMQTKGIWIWSESIKVTQKDEAGNDKEGEVLVMDCEAFTGRPDQNTNLGLEILALACLLSSHLILCSSQSINTQSLQDLEILTEIPTVIQIRKQQDSRNYLGNFLPSLSWVISGPDIKLGGQSATKYLEKSLSKQVGESGAITNIKSTLKSFFKKRACFSIPPLVDEKNAQQKSAYQASMGAFIDYVKSSTDPKKINGKPISGAVLSSMAQAFVHRFHKKAPAIISAAFERSVASESRRNKEKLFIRYLDKMGLIENDMPCDEEHLWKEHQLALKELLKEFDAMMLGVFEQEEVQEERSSLIERIDAYYEDLKAANSKASDARCRDAFKASFDPIRQESLKYNEDGSANVTELEQIFLAAINKYQDQALGPMVESVFAEEISFLIPHMCSLLRDMYNHSETEKEELEREVKNLTRHRDEARAGEKRLRDLLEETNRNYEKQLEQREKQISELQANVNSRIHAAENKARLQAREIQGLKLELEQSQKEREMMIEAERDIYEKRIGDLDSKVYKLQLENSKYEKMLDELREEQEKLISDKNEQINDLSRRIKLMETQSESPSPRQDSSILRSFRDYLEDIFNKFSKEQNSNSKYLSQLERVSSLQNELNQVRLREQENKNKLIDEYEEKIRQIRSEKDAIAKELSDLLEKQRTEMSLTFDSLSTDVETNSKSGSEREELLKRAVEEKLEISNELTKREQQLIDQHEAMDAYKKQIEQLQIELDDRDNMLNRLKIENVEEKDDNDILISLMGVVMEVQQKKRNVQTIHLGRIQNSDNRGKVAKLFKKFGIPYE